MQQKGVEQDNLYNATCLESLLNSTANIAHILQKMGRDMLCWLAGKSLHYFDFLFSLKAIEIFSLQVKFVCLI